MVCEADQHEARRAEMQPGAAEEIEKIYTYYMQLKTFQSILSWFPFPIYRRTAILAGIPVNAYEGSIFEPVQPSTLTIRGNLSGVTINEEKDIHLFAAEDQIVLIGSLFGESYLPGYAPKHALPPDTKVKRGRKPKLKEKKRIPKGNGHYFASQISFHIKSQTKLGKIYKFKLFRNGVFQIPGVLNANMTDAVGPMEILRAYLSRFYKDVAITDLKPQMRNCKTILSDSQLAIKTKELGKALLDECTNGPNPMKMEDVKYITDKSSARVVIKFACPIKKNPKKQSTLKIFSTKLNYEGHLSTQNIMLTHHWFNNFLLDHYDTVIYDPNLPIYQIAPVVAAVPQTLFNDDAVVPEDDPYNIS